MHTLCPVQYMVCGMTPVTSCMLRAHALTHARRRACAHGCTRALTHGHMYVRLHLSTQFNPIQCKARQGKTRQDKTREGKARQ